jgi:hypothetical protein
MGEGAAGAAAVLFAVCVDVLNPSPGSSRGTCELREEGALIPLVPPAGDPCVMPLDGPEENDEVDGSDDVGTLSGSVPVFVVVWACAVATAPRQMIAAKITRCIAFSCIESSHGLRMRDNAWSVKKGHEV